jgi:hypothetical protein
MLQRCTGVNVLISTIDRLFLTQKSLQALNASLAPLLTHFSLTIYHDTECDRLDIIAPAAIAPGDPHPLLALLIDQWPIVVISAYQQVGVMRVRLVYADRVTVILDTLIPATVSNPGF